MAAYWRIVEENLHLLRSPRPRSQEMEHLLEKISLLIFKWFNEAGARVEDAEVLTKQTISTICNRFHEDFDRDSSGQHAGAFQAWCEGIATQLLEQRQASRGVDDAFEAAMPSGVASAISISMGFLTGFDRDVLVALFEKDEAALARRLEVSIADLDAPIARERIAQTITRFRDLLFLDPDIKRWLDKSGGTTHDQS